jgi:hypothetical protein
MLYNININLVAVIVAAVMNMIVGAVWYSPVLFGNQWMRIIGISKKRLDKIKKRGMGKVYLIAFIGTFVMSYVLAMIVGYSGAFSFREGMEVGLWLGIGLIAPSMLGSVLWERRPVKLYLINVGYYFVSLSIAGGIIAVWK